MEVYVYAYRYGLAGGDDAEDVEKDEEKIGNIEG